jgi:hypothetical protein
MVLAAANTNMSASPDVIMPGSPIRLPGVAGPVMWRAEIDPEEIKVTCLMIRLPNGAIDTITFDTKTGIRVSREYNNAPVDITPEMHRQILIHARIISGVHLELALENAV